MGFSIEILNIPLGQVVRPQSLTALTVREGGDPTNFADLRLMIVYTGWVIADIKGGVSRGTAISFVPTSEDPNGDRRIQTFKEPGLLGNVVVPDAQAVVAAAVASFGESPEVAAVDEAHVDLEQHNFPNAVVPPGSPPPRVLVLRAQLAAFDGALHRFGYQVTVLAHPNLKGDILLVPNDRIPVG